MTQASTPSNGFRRGGLWSMLAAIGPGIVVTGSVIGSGELINTPVQAARFGFVLLWAVLVSCVIKYFLQVEIARHCLVHGRSTMQALNELPGPHFFGSSWINWIYMVGYVSVMLTVVGIIGSLGGLLTTLAPLAESPERSAQLWGGICCLLALVSLWQGFYNHLETLVTLLVAGFSLSVGVGVLLIQRTESRISADDVWSGLTFSLGDHPAAAGIAVVSLMGALGAAANELFMYPYWIQEKGYAAQLGDPDDPQWTARVRHWVHTIRLDVGLATLVATIVTAAFYLLGAAVLWRRGEVPQGFEAVDQISDVYTQTYGPWSRLVFFFGAFCTLFSTLVVVVAASGRIWADFLATVGLLDRRNAQQNRRCHQVVQVIWLVGLFLAYMTLNVGPVTSIVVGQFILGGFMTPLLMFAICWMAFHTDARVRMGRWWAAALVSSVAIILACVAGSLAFQLQRPAGGETGWIPLFDGRSLAGWRASEHKDSCRVADGTIVMGGGGRSHLFYDGPVENHDFKNFELRLEVKTEPGSNSGIFFHTQYQEEGWPAKGYEAQVNNTQQDWRRTGSLYAVEDVRESPVRDGEWFDYHIVVHGKRIVLNVNGEPIVDYIEPENPPQPDPTRDRRLSHGTIALQAHDPASTVYFRNIRIKPLPEESSEHGARSRE